MSAEGSTKTKVRTYRRARPKAANPAAQAAFLLAPDPEDPRLTRRLRGLDQDGAAVETDVVEERPLTLFLNGQEIVTMMTIGDYPDYLSVGFLLNQNMLKPDDVITAVDYDGELELVVVRTERETDYEEKLKKKIRTSGCAQGTVFGDLMEKFEEVALPAEAELRTSWLYTLARKINSVPSLYLGAGAIHGCVLCQGDRPLVYLEDVGRHNAVDKIAGYMFLHGIGPDAAPPAMSQIADRARRNPRMDFARWWTEVGWVTAPSLSTWEFRSQAENRQLNVRPAQLWRTTVVCS